MLLKADSFDHYVTADILRKWTASSGALAIGAYGRNSTSGLSVTNSYSYVSMVVADSATIVVGVGFKLVTGYGTGPILRLQDGATVHIDLRLDGANRLTITRNGTLLETSTFVPSVGVYYYLELKVLIADAGTWEVRINAATVMSGSGDTRNAGDAWANTVQLSSVASGYTVYWDDFVVCDTTGSYNNDFLGDVRVRAVLPDADGASVDWTASAGADYACVDEAVPNDDTDYVESATPGHKELVGFAALGITGVVLATQALHCLRKTDAGTRTIRPLTRSGGTDYNGSNENLADSYAYHCEIREVDPDTSAPWTVAGVDAAQFGVELVA